MKASVKSTHDNKLHYMNYMEYSLVRGATVYPLPVVLKHLHFENEYSIYIQLSVIHNYTSGED